MTPNSTILIIEDDPDVLILVEKILQGAGYQVLKAENGKTGLQLCKEKRPHLIFLDISLPDINGLEVAKTIKSTEEIKEIPIVVLSAQAMQGTQDKVLKANCNDYISKPFLPHQLTSMAKKYLE